MEILNKMGYLILDDPFITAGDLAKKLGYAEEKTVYYWLSKENYPGLQAFKRAVIAGRYLLPAAKARESQTHYGRIPIVQGFASDGSVVLTSESLSDSLVANALGKFAWRYQGPDQGPVKHGDLLFLAKLERKDMAKWVIAGSPRTPIVLLKIKIGTEAVFVHPETHEPAKVPTELYRIVQILRTL